MKNYGFIKVAGGVPEVKVADTAFNARAIVALIKQAVHEQVRAVVLPELCVTGYTCGDLFLQPSLIKSAEDALAQILTQTQKEDIVFIVGLPVYAGALLLNAAAVCYKGRICGVVPKTFLPNYNEFYEMRWFASALDFSGDNVILCGQEVPLGTDLMFEAGGVKFGVEICEDVWAVTAPSAELALQGADIVFNLSASNALVGKRAYTENLLAQQSARCLCGYVYASSGYGESTTDVVFGGNSYIFENGHLLAESTPFQTGAQLVSTEIDVQFLHRERAVNTSFRSLSSLAQNEPYELIATGQKEAQIAHLTRSVAQTPFVPAGEELAQNCEEIFNIQVTALASRLQAAHAKNAVIGISGGLDSTLALLVTAKAFDKLGLARKQILAVTMPGFGTTDRTYQNALLLMKKLGVTSREIDIKPACLQHFKDIGHDVSAHDTTYENVQARERTQILMDLANKCGGLVVGTGDLSELALGWATYNGDHMSMYGVNAGVPKTLVRSLVLWAAKNASDTKVRAVLQDIADTPISPELLPADKKGRIAQKTEDLVGPYELHDFFLYHFLRRGCAPAKIFFLARKAFGKKYTGAVIKKWLLIFFKRFFAQQFKRSCLPDGPKVGSVSLSPRGDLRMPSDASAQTWLAEIEKL